MHDLRRQVAPALSAALAVLAVGCFGELTLQLDGQQRADFLPDGGTVERDGRVGFDGGGVGVDGGGTVVCQTPLAVFERETWPKAGKAVCAGCHVSGGAAEGSGFMLKDESALTSEGLTLAEFYAHNLGQFRTHAIEDRDGVPRFLSKATGELAHGGGDVAPPDSDAYQSMEALITAFETEGIETCEEPPEIAPLDDITLLSPAGTARKAAMMLGGTLPPAEQLEQLRELPEDRAWDVIDEGLDELFQTEAFHEWLKYAWNEVFMFRGLWELDVTREFMVVSPTDFRARTWGFLNRGAFGCTTDWDGVTTWQRFGYQSLEVCENNRFAVGYLSRRISWSLMEGPLELIAWIVQNDRPFTDILTTDVVMMNYYSSVAYYGSARPAENPWVAQHLGGLPVDTVEHPAGSTIASIDLPFLHEFHPMRSTQRHRVTRPVQGEPLVWENLAPAEYPRAGLLTDQLYLTRYPTTDTNLNRHRTWAFMNQFLGVDILALADRRADPAAAELGSDQPTIDDPNCNVCHNVMDPVAGLFQDFGNDARWQPNREWPPEDQPNMLGPGLSIIGPNQGTAYDPDSNDLAPLQWLGAETVKDPRFASQMVRHAFLQLTGHEPMQLPGNSEEPGWRGRMTAYELQTQFLSELREGFVANNFDMKWVYKQIIKSPWFRAVDLASPEVANSPERLGATESFGDGDQLLTPFELHRKVSAILERPWQYRGWRMRGNNLQVVNENAPANDFLLRFNSDNDFRYVDSIYRDMYGGIDFMNNTSRLTLPSSVMAAAGRRIANEIACGSVAREFARDPNARSFLGRVEPGQSSADNPMVREAIRELHGRMLGELDPDPAAVEATVSLYDEVLADGQAALADGLADVALPPHCAAADIVNDPTYGVRAWMAVVTYLALDASFLFHW